jgi:hypothetical protein
VCRPTRTLAQAGRHRRARLVPALVHAGAGHDLGTDLGRPVAADVNQEDEEGRFVMTVILLLLILILMLWLHMKGFV